MPAPGEDLMAFSTVAIGEGPHRLGKDAAGAPSLLVSLADTGRPSTPSIELQHISVQHAVHCRLLRPGRAPEDAILTVVRCRDADPALAAYFLAVIEGTLPILGPAPSDQRVRAVVDSLTELFRALEVPPRKSIQGLWAELFLLDHAHDPISMVAAWHAAPDEPYDFAEAGRRIEVKSAAGELRAHHFSLVQLAPPAGVHAVVASLIVVRSGGGVAVDELLGAARARVASRPDLISRLDQVVAESLGHAWRNGLTERFDAERALESLAFYDAAQIPAVRRQDVPPEVTDVRFRSDLTHVAALDESAMRAHGGLFQAALPRRGHGRR